MSPQDWERLLLDATDRVRAGVSKASRNGGGTRPLGRGASGDRTILADKVAEDVLLEALGSKGARVLSEEAGSVGDPHVKSLAVVDPLDGSSNFERGIPFYCTSVAVAEGESADDIVVGVVRSLVTGEVYHAIRGGGARKNGRPIRTSGVNSVPEAVIGVDLSRGTRSQVASLGLLISRAKRQLHLGANALEICYVADGVTDAFVDAREDIRITDFAAAYLIAKEAGATVSDVKGEPLNPVFDLKHRFSFVASANPTLHREILELCRPPRARRG